MVARNFSAFDLSFDLNLIAKDLFRKDRESNGILLLLLGSSAASNSSIRGIKSCGIWLVTTNTSVIIPLVDYIFDDTFIYL